MHPRQQYAAKFSQQLLGNTNNSQLDMTLLFLFYDIPVRCAVYI